MRSLFVKSVAALSLGTALLGHSVLANSDHRIETVVAVPSVKVSYRDLDISKPWGLEVLYSRIQHAARGVCSLDQTPRELARAHVARTCYRAAIDNAVNQINRPMLTSLHRAKSKHV
ncbi:UrcA family protein [Steroidobacter sp. S1-65]|uniref:UrcA family protein n=1 Tax=Steroidobacter gossypii TaxID=2805490 RepID=A0ABS1X0Q8_9GAMM|nr:UrcA family protein [Steroidobacter gossypii]MBM0106810.1 UrcA family protein [Steroidobacter gossypii]